MGRLIDAEELLEVLEEYIEYDPFDIYKEEPLLNISFEQMEDIIAEMPTAKPTANIIERIMQKTHRFLQKVFGRKKCPEM